jgi:hypothetical protein
MRQERRTHDGQGLAGLAQRQHGVVSARQLMAFDFPPRTITRWMQDGKLHRLHRGVYAVGHGALTWQGRLVAAVLAN